MMLQDLWNAATASNNSNSIDKPSSSSCSSSSTRLSSSAPSSPTIKYIAKAKHSQPFHVANKVPMGDTPYVKAKRVQLVDKDPDKAIALFWAAINAGDRVDSALKDMAIVMKQQNRAEEAIEAIKSLRSRCSDQAQESLDNILLDLYKRCGRLDDQIFLLRHKLLLIQQGLAFNGKRTKTARSQGRKFQVSLEQEATRLLGNLGWALMQKESYVEAEDAYRRALLIGPDNNKMCNLGICLMKQGRLTEAKETLKKVKPAISDGPRGVDSHLKAFERAQEMLLDLESKIPFITTSTWSTNFDPKLMVSQSLSSSSIWQPQPCVDDDLFSLLRPFQQQHQDPIFGDENVDLNRGGFGSRTTTGGKNTSEIAPPPPLSSMCSSSMLGNSLRIDAPPFYSKLSNLKGTKTTTTTATTNQVAVMGNRQQQQQQGVVDPLGNLKRSRPSATKKVIGEEERRQPLEQQRSRRRSLTFEEVPPMGSPAARWKDMLPDNKAFDEAIVAAVLAPVLEAAAEVAVVEVAEKEEEGCGKNEEWRSPLVDRKRLRVFEDITQSIVSNPRF